MIAVDQEQQAPSHGQIRVIDTVINMLVDDSLWRDMKLDFRKRAELGKDRYGTYLMSHNGRNALLDLYQELLDAVMYATQHYIECEDQDENKQWALDLVRVLIEECVGVRQQLVEVHGVKLHND